MASMGGIEITLAHLVKPIKIDLNFATACMINFNNR